MIKRRMMNRYSEILPVGPQEASHQSGLLSRRLSAPENTEGIKPEDLDNLFLPFRQIGSGLTQQYDGTEAIAAGLGKPAVRRAWKVTPAPARSPGGGPSA
jgi:hypothetical protein